MPAISEKTAILFTGATGKTSIGRTQLRLPLNGIPVPGYIGGSVLQKILQHPEANTFEITALVRDAGKAQILETKFGVKAVVGSMEELDKLTELAEKAHIVVQVVRAQRIGDVHQVY